MRIIARIRAPLARIYILPFPQTQTNFSTLLFERGQVKTLNPFCLRPVRRKASQYRESQPAQNEMLKHSCQSKVVSSLVVFEFGQLKSVPRETQDLW